MRKLAIIGLLLFAALPCFAQTTGSISVTSPHLPRTFINSTINSTNFPGLFSSPVVRTVCASACNYTTAQAAIYGIATDAPSCNEILEIDDRADGFTTSFSNVAGLQYQQSDGAPYICPVNSVVWIRPLNGYASLPAQGTKITLTNKATYTPDMWGIDFSCTISTCKFDSVFQIPDGTVGLIITGYDGEASGTNVYNMLGLGSGSNCPGLSSCPLPGSSSSTTAYANHIWVDRSVMETTSYSTLLDRGIAADATFWSITDSYIGGVGETMTDACNTYSDAQDIYDFNSPGPIKIVNNFLYGMAAETVFFGGATPLNPWIVPDDVEIRQNVIANDISQRGLYSVKNLLENKNVIRELVDGNLFQYSWDQIGACGGSQGGTAIDLSNIAASNENTQHAEVADITFSNNDLQHFNILFNWQAHSFASYSQWPVTARGVWENNLAQDGSISYDFEPPHTISIGNLVASGGSATATISSTSGFQNSAYMTVSGCTGPDTDFNLALIKPTSVTGTTVVFPVPFGTSQTSTTVCNIATQDKVTAGFSIIPIPNQMYPASQNGVTATAHDITNNVATVDFTTQIPVSITAASWASSLMTYTFSSSLYWPAIGDVVTITGLSPAGCNVAGVNVLGSNFSQLIVAMASNPGTCSGTGSMVGNVRFLVGATMKTTGFSGADTAFNVGYGRSVITAVTPTSISYTVLPTANQSGSTTGSLTTLTFDPGPYDTLVSDSADYSGLCPSGETCPGTQNGEELGQLQGLTTYSCVANGNGFVPHLIFNNLVFVGDVDGIPVSGGCSMTWVNDNIYLDLINKGIVAVTPTGTFFAGWPGPLTVGTALNGGNPLNPTTVDSVLGTSSYAICAAGDATVGTYTSMTSCELLGTYAGKGVNVPQILAHFTLGNDSTLWGARTSW